MKRKQIEIDLLFQALGDGTRRSIVHRLSRGPVSVSQLADQLGITLTAVGQHLAMLEACGLAVTEKVGRVRTCQMASAGLDVLEKWVRQHRSEWEKRMDALEQVLNEPN